MTRLSRLLAAAVLAVLGSLVAAPVAFADTSLPFKDPNVNGALGFCDKNDKPVTKGNIRDVPFVWKTVSATPAPKAWAVKGGKAALYAFSPMKNVNPLEWSPFQMTVSAVYSNRAHPMAQATYRDASMEFHTTGLPPTLDGLVQLRMYFSAPNQQGHMQPYPAAVIRVTGDTWTLVQGDTNPACTSGTAVSATTMLLPDKMVPSAPPTWAANASQAPSGGASSTAGASAGGPGSADPLSAGETGAGATILDQPQAAAQSTSIPAIPIAIGLLAVTALAAFGVAAWIARRGSASSRH